MHRGTSRNWAKLGCWLEAVLLVPWLLYWLWVRPSYFLETPWFWGVVVVAIIVAIATVALAIVTRGDPDPLNTVNRRTELDTAVRAKWK